MRRFVPVFALLLALIPALAHAQANQTPPSQDSNEMKDGYIAPWFGKISLSDSDDDQAPSKKAFGVSFGFWQRGILGAEIDLGMANKFFEDGAIGTSKLLTLTANAIIGPWINFTDNQALRPYVVLGGGLARSTFKDFLVLGNTSENRGVITIGGGAHLYLAKAFGIRVDYRILKDFGSKEDTPDSSDFGLTGRNFKRFSIAALICF